MEDPHVGSEKNVEIELASMKEKQFNSPPSPLLRNVNGVYKFESYSLLSWVPMVMGGLSAITFSLILIILTPHDWGISFVAVVFGVTCIFLAKHEQYVFNKSRGKATVTQFSIHGKHVRSFWLYEIRDVVLEEQVDIQGGLECDMVLLLRSGERLKLFGYHFIMMDPKIKYKICNELKAFLADVSETKR